MSTLQKPNLESPIQNPEQLVDFFRNGARPREDWGIGAEMEKFRAATQRSMDALFALEPFASRRGDFNVWAIAPPAPGRWGTAA